MPRYLFNIRDQHGLERDREGMELPDLHAVRREALKGSKRMVADSLKSGVPLDEALRRAFEVADEAGQIVLTLPFAEGAQANLRGGRPLN